TQIPHVPHETSGRPIPARPTPVRRIHYTFHNPIFPTPGNKSPRGLRVSHGPPVMLALVAVPHPADTAPRLPRLARLPRNGRPALSTGAQPGPRLHAHRTPQARRWGGGEIPADMAASPRSPGPPH